MLLTILNFRYRVRSGRSGSNKTFSTKSSMRRGIAGRRPSSSARKPARRSCSRAGSSLRGNRFASQQPRARADGGWRAICRHGIAHILTGYDHLLFIAALALAVTSFWELFKIIAIFTLAHTITLTLAVFDVVRLPSQIVEPIIAASIVFVALQNVFWPGTSRGAGAAQRGVFLRIVSRPWLRRRTPGCDVGNAGRRRERGHSFIQPRCGNRSPMRGPAALWPNEVRSSAGAEVHAPTRLRVVPANGFCAAARP